MRPVATALAAAVIATAAVLADCDTAETAGPATSGPDPATTVVTTTPTRSPSSSSRTHPDPFTTVPLDPRVADRFRRTEVLVADQARGMTAAPHGESEGEVAHRWTRDRRPLSVWSLEHRGARRAGYGAVVTDAVIMDAAAGGPGDWVLRAELAHTVDTPSHPSDAAGLRLSFVRTPGGGSEQQTLSLGSELRYQLPPPASGSEGYRVDQELTVRTGTPDELTRRFTASAASFRAEADRELVTVERAALAALDSDLKGCVVPPSSCSGSEYPDGQSGCPSPSTCIPERLTPGQRAEVRAAIRSDISARRALVRTHGTAWYRLLTLFPWQRLR